MQTVRLGRTGLDVSVVGLGCGGHSRLGMATGHDEAHAVRSVQHALDLGIGFIDTARSYGTEAAVGKALRGRRSDVVLSTKASEGRGATSSRREWSTASTRRASTSVLPHSTRATRSASCAITRTWRRSSGPRTASAATSRARTSS
ncbi:MAG: aldo/keto reductase [Ardenticatenales bacterium]|nr:aldo/keto reductase [Ardenticatenales bacterium]